MNIYISGPIIETIGCKEKFMEAEEMIKELFGECKVINPIDIYFHGSNNGWTGNMDDRISMLEKCTHIHMMEGWENSKSACVEYFLAKDKGMVFV